MRERGERERGEERERDERERRERTLILKDSSIRSIWI